MRRNRLRPRSLNVRRWDADDADADVDADADADVDDNALVFALSDVACWWLCRRPCPDKAGSTLVEENRKDEEEEEEDAPGAVSSLLS